MNIEKALVVDDSKVAHFTLRKLLTERGIEVDWVGSGKDAIAYMQEQTPNVVFMDVMMPGIDGFETTRIITTNPAIAAAPIVMCSANATDEDRQNAKQSGALGFLSKPYTPAQLDGVLSSVSEAAAVATPPPAVAEPAKAEPEKPFAEPATVAMAELQQLAAEARNTAEQAAKRIAAEVARATAEQTAYGLAEAAGRKSLQEAVHAAREAAEDVAETARTQTEQAARAVAEHTARAVAEDAARTVAEQVARDVSEGMVLEGLAQSQQSTVKGLEEQIAHQVRAGLARTLSGDEFQQQLAQIARQSAESMLPRVESVAQQAAVRALEETASRAVVGKDEVSPTTILKRANLAMVIALVALVAAVALRFLL